MRPIDPSPPDQRLAEVARILATGILRLRARVALPTADPAPEKLTNSPPPSLDLPPETVLSVHDSQRLDIKRPPYR